MNAVSATAFGGVRAVLLDLDGTLLDTAPELAAAAADMLEELGLEPVTPGQVRNFIGKGIPNLVRRTLEASLGRPADCSPAESGTCERYPGSRHAQIHVDAIEGVDRQWPVVPVVADKEAKG